MSKGNPGSFSASLGLQQLADFIQVFLADFPALCEMHQERRGGAVEHALDEVRHHAADDFRTRLGGLVDIRPFAGILVQTSLLFEDTHHRQHRRVRDLPVLAAVPRRPREPSRCRASRRLS